MSHIRSKETLLIAKDFFDEDEQNKDEKTNIVVSDDGDGLTENAEELVSNVYNIQNSSDVIFGPVTQITGPVTIYQCGTTQEIFRRVNCKTGAQTELDKDTSTTPKQPTTKPKLKKALITFVIVLIICILLYILLQKLLLNHKIVDITITTEIISKARWGGRPTGNLPKLAHPTPIVIIKHTGGVNCLNFTTCSLLIRDIQDAHIKLGFQDIIYNFLIGGDGEVYEGRGWDVQNIQNNTIDVCFIGNYMIYEPRPLMIGNTKWLLKEGLSLGKLHKEYKVVGHDQTANTLSPDFFKSPTTSILAVERCPILHWLLKPHHVPDKFTCKLLPLFILLLTITITVILTVLVTRLFLISRPTEKIYGTSLSTHRLIYRNEWGGQLPTSTITNLKHPVLNVVVSHSESGFCTSVEDCSEVVRDLQYHHVAILKSEDIGYNFLIGGDANIYVGRGWDLESYRKDSNFAFCFIGNFQSDLLLPDMIEAGQMLLAQGVEMGKLAKNYKLLAHNHTMDSPGENVYRIIKESMHFDRS